MLIDGRKLRSGVCLQARICIVGTGMGAISTGLGLIEAGNDVLFIEAGPVTEHRSDPPALRAEFVGRPFQLPRSRGLEVGGGTAFWHGICAELDDIDFQQRNWIKHSGWPITRHDMVPYYQKAWDILCRGDRSIQPLVTAGLKSQPVASGQLENKIYQYVSPPFRGKELLLNWCEKGRASCVTNSVALQLLFEGDSSAKQLVVGSGGHIFKVKAEIFVVAAGGLETPRLLLNSSRGGTPRPSEHGWWIGRNLMDHPTAYVSQLVFHKSVEGRMFSGYDIGGQVKALPGIVFKPEFQRILGLANHTVFVRPGIDSKKIPNQSVMSFLGVRGVRDLNSIHLRAMVRSKYIRWRVIHQRFGLNSRTRFGDLFFMTEQLPNPGSRVDLSEDKHDEYDYPIARINWQLSKRDINCFERGINLLLRELEMHPSVRNVRKDGIDDWLRSLSSAAHHLGTARMAREPANGVVDPNLKLFGSNNVWVCDGSVFPTGGSVNPSLTIFALGQRLAAHLSARSVSESNNARGRVLCS